MKRTQVYLPESLHRDLMLLAKQEGTNFSSLIRKGGEQLIAEIKKKKKKNWGKGFIGAGSKRGPQNLSQKIDQYLYGGAKNTR